jgi:hypothetical protein
VRGDFSLGCGRHGPTAPLADDIDPQRSQEFAMTRWAAPVDIAGARTAAHGLRDPIR